MEKKNIPRILRYIIFFPCSDSEPIDDAEEVLDANIEIADEKLDSQRFGTVPEHVEFIKLIRDAKKEADETKSKVNVTWRGYKTSVLPDLLPLTVKALRDRLIWALRGIYNIKTSEREVNNQIKIT